MWCYRREVFFVSSVFRFLAVAATGRVSEEKARARVNRSKNISIAGVVFGIIVTVSSLVIYFV